MQKSYWQYKHQQHLNSPTTPLLPASVSRHMDNIKELQNDALETESCPESDDCEIEYSDMSIRRHQKSTLSSVLLNNKFTDVTFIVGANKVKFEAIRSLMAAISPVFEAMLFGHMNESKLHSEIIIEDVDEKGFKTVIDFAYMQKPKIYATNLISVHQIADKYQIKVLSSLCETLFNRIIHTKNVLLLLSDAMHFRSEQFINRCLEYLSQCGSYPKYILESKGFLKMSVNAMKLFLQSDDLNIVEDKLWGYIMKWVKYQIQHQNDRKMKYPNNDDAKYDHESDDDAKSMLNNLLKEISPFIRFGAMSPEYFIENVKNLNFLTDKEIISIMTDQIYKKYHPRNIMPYPGNLPFKCLVFPDDDESEDSDYDSENSEDEEQYQCDVEEDYCSTDEEQII